MAEETELFYVRIPVGMHVRAPRGDSTAAHQLAEDYLASALNREGTDGINPAIQAAIIGDDEDHEVINDLGDTVGWRR